MNYFAKWYPYRVTGSEWEDGTVIKTFRDFGFVDRYTGNYIQSIMPSEKKGTYENKYSREIKWKTDNFNNFYFRPYFNTGSGFSLYTPTANNIEFWSQGEYYVGPGSMCLYFLPLKDNGFFLTTCSGPVSFGDDSQIYPLTYLLNYTYDEFNSWDHRGDKVFSVVGIPITQGENQGGLIYLHWGLYHYGGSGHYNDYTSYYHDIFLSSNRYNDFQSFSDTATNKRTILNDNSNFIFSKIPLQNSFMDNLYIATQVPNNILPGSFFSIDNKNYLLIFDNLVIQLKEGE